LAPAAVELIYGALAENPQRVGGPLRFELEGKHIARRGAYRVVYVIDDQRRIVVKAFTHRGDAYRRR
jgi:mRNA-degrading endonuclease RelE of RelBE toxin-antitoxin system